jgi:hypothetical protein
VRWGGHLVGGVKWRVLVLYTRFGGVSLSTLDFGISVFLVDCVCVVDDRLHDSTRRDDALDHQHDLFSSRLLQSFATTTVCTQT